ncbi:hypothetical protein J4Q44_G00241550 [Coregonus suidteri]|uniref:GPI ethanolamine phosphate transferase 3 n=1 Tax=Coregonus suidteri TaxID=861788 RepID=A0AAN8QIK7_9TELE
MDDKLTQMYGVIRSVLDRLHNDTLLVVMGDHGMTDTRGREPEGDRCCYFPLQPLFPASPSQSDPEVVPQTDLVPTLTHLLGIPIPYSSVGQVLLPLFPADSQTGGAPAGLSQVEALWINAKPVNRFLETYSSIAKDIPPESLSAAGRLLPPLL